MVCVSGGKDSYAMLDILQKLQARAPVRFELIAVNLDQKQPGFPEHVLPQYLGQQGVPFHIENQDTYSIVKRLIPEGKTLCSLCSRLRRGILYRVADELGATKIALGHHRDDILQTFFLNMFFGGKLKGMPPKLVSDDGRHIVIRPMALVAERDLVRWAAHRQFPIIPCSLCGSQVNLQRKQVAAMLHDWEKQHPGRIESMFTALQNVVPSHLMDGTRHDFKGLTTTGVADPDGDKAFDTEEFPATQGRCQSRTMQCRRCATIFTVAELQSASLSNSTRRLGLLAMQSTITARGQTVVPAAIRNQLHLGPSDRLEWILDNGSIRVVPVRSNPIDAFRGQGKGGATARLLAARKQDSARE